MGSIPTNRLEHLEIAFVIVTGPGDVQGNPLVLLWHLIGQWLQIQPLIGQGNPLRLLWHLIGQCWLQIKPLIGKRYSLQSSVLQTIPHPGDVSLGAHSVPHLFSVLFPEASVVTNSQNRPNTKYI